jgi:hypothetical protein
VATGGYTYEPWLADVPGIDAVEPDLTLRGIRYAWEAMRGGTEPAAGPETTDAIADATEARAEVRR